LTSKIKFYTYTRIFEGLSLGFWIKIGSEAIEKDFRPPLFAKLEKGEDLQAKKSMCWIVWSGDINNFVKIGERTAEFQHIDVASIFPPQAIVDWFEFGWHGFKLPE
jgi:hypothetical protein